MRRRIGIDVGGTNTDAVLLEDDAVAAGDLPAGSAISAAVEAVLPAAGRLPALVLTAAPPVSLANVRSSLSACRSLSVNVGGSNRKASGD